MRSPIQPSRVALFGGLLWAALSGSCTLLVVAFSVDKGFRVHPTENLALGLSVGVGIASVAFGLVVSCLGGLLDFFARMRRERQP